MAAARYDIRKTHNEMWSVFDTQSGIAAALDGEYLIDMELEDADDLADLLNYLQAQREAATLQ